MALPTSWPFSTRKRKIYLRETAAESSALPDTGAALVLSSLGEFLPYVLPKAPGCSEPYALFCLRQAAIAFCERTRCWREFLTITVSSTNSTIVDPSNATVHEIEEAWHNGRKLSPISFAGADPVELVGGTAYAGSPEAFTQSSPGTISIYPYQAGTLRLSVFLKPRQGQSLGGYPSDPLADAFNAVPPFMLQHHAETLAAGALARILSTPNETFTDPQGAGVYATMFDQRAAAFSSMKLRGQQRAPIRTKPNWF